MNKKYIYIVVNNIFVKEDNNPLCSAILSSFL
jgi:hypothetical protein